MGSRHRVHGKVYSLCLALDFARRPGRGGSCTDIHGSGDFPLSMINQVLSSNGYIKGTEYWTTENIADGLNGLCTCVEVRGSLGLVQPRPSDMGFFGASGADYRSIFSFVKMIIFAAYMCFAFSWSEYKKMKPYPGHHTPVLRSFFSSQNYGE